MFTTLVSTATLAQHLDHPNWVICDCRHDLTQPEAGRRAYREAHIPGARLVHLDEDLSGPRTGTNGRHPLPDPQALAARLGALGIGADTQVVAYDASGGTYAARLWWLLRWIGDEACAVLDGGWDAWRVAGLPISTEAPTPRPARHPVQLKPALGVDVARVKENLSQRAFVLLDARSADRFRGENETLDPVAGHIPGALNRFFRMNLGPDGTFKGAAALKEEFSDLLGDTRASEVVHYCGSGVSACHNLLAMEIARLSGSRLYPGSWSEWCSDPSRPVAKGGV
ncbi:MAG: sulfurtransferase [Betaproteobacteria bacterium]|nr:sulfurtransferase [Betaproteobacteria bacterium]